MARVLITGCSSGIGRTLAETLTARGHEVIASARRINSLNDLGVHRRVQLDVADAASVRRAVDDAGDVDVLINNAGVSLWGPLERNSIDQVQRLLETNLIGALRVSQAVLPGMRRRARGLILQISSGAARRPQPMLGIYAASKAALEAVSMSMRIELTGTGVAVAVVVVGAVESDIDKNRVVDAAVGSCYEEIAARMIARTRVIREKALPATEVAQVVATLIDQTHPPFRTYVGESYRRSVTEMAGLSDEEFEARVSRDLFASR